MPFTLAHGAAALPFQRTRLVYSAVLVGTFAPDFEYFLRLAPDDRFSHTLLGTFSLTLPLALVVLWLFHRFVKAPVIALLPDVLQTRLEAYRMRFQFWGASRFLLIIVSLLLGVATHLAWDSFTHPNTWMYYHWSLLRTPVGLPFPRALPTYKVFQHGSTFAGIALLSMYFLCWYRATPVSPRVSASRMLPERKVLVISAVIGLAMLGAVVRALLGAGIPVGHSILKKFAGEFVTTMIALVWWQLLLRGLFLSSRSC